MKLFKEITKTISCNTLSCDAKIVDTNTSELTVRDIEMLIGIVSKLNHVNDYTNTLPILHEIDALLITDGTVIGIYNPEADKIENMVATIAKEFIPEFGRYTYPKIRNCETFFESQRGKFCSFVYLRCKDNLLKNRQREIIKIVLPHLYSTTMKLYLMSRQLLVLGLTSRELEVMQWIATGKDNWSISKILGVSERTVKFHNCNIYRKLGVTTKSEAISSYLRHVSCNEFTIVDTTA